jgi:hypothetical protein
VGGRIPAIGKSENRSGVSVSASDQILVDNSADLRNPTSSYARLLLVGYPGERACA